jgi:hypothetical protein
MYNPYMRDIDILNKIIENDGCCSWLPNRKICDACPLGKIDESKSCLESVLGIKHLALMGDSLAINARYKKFAEELLLDLCMEQLLENRDKVK